MYFQTKRWKTRLDTITLLSCHVFILDWAEAHSLIHSGLKNNCLESRMPLSNWKVMERQPWSKKYKKILLTLRKPLSRKGYAERTFKNACITTRLPITSFVVKTRKSSQFLNTKMLLFLKHQAFFFIFIWYSINSFSILKHLASDRNIIFSQTSKEKSIKKKVQKETNHLMKKIHGQATNEKDHGVTEGWKLWITRQTQFLKNCFFWPARLIPQRPHFLALSKG